VVVAMALTEWIEGLERTPAASTHFTTVDGSELIEHSPPLIADLARRFMEAKSSRAYLAAYADRLDWAVLSQRLASGPEKVRRGDFGEVVAVGWLEDYAHLAVPMKKLRLQINPGQTLPGTDAVGFRVVDGIVERAHFLESKLRTTPAFLKTVGTQAYGQLVSDRPEGFLEILQFVHERLFDTEHPLCEPVSVYLAGRAVEPEDDAHEIVLVVETAVWHEDVLANLDAVADDLPGCTVHALLCEGLAELVDSTLASIGLELVPGMDED
jgi:hypothetical protein